MLPLDGTTSDPYSACELDGGGLRREQLERGPRPLGSITAGTGARLSPGPEGQAPDPCCAAASSLVLPQVRP